MPKQLLVNRLVNYQGYTHSKAKSVVNAFIQAVKGALVSGKNVELEGIGTLAVVGRPQKRRIERNLKHQVVSIRTVPRQAKTVKLRSRLDLSYKD
jgi:nucleoid DNA-binding protein